MRRPFRYADEAEWTAYEPHVHGRVVAHLNPLVAMAQLVASIV